MKTKCKANILYMLCAFLCIQIKLIGVNWRRLFSSLHSAHCTVHTHLSFHFFLIFIICLFSPIHVYISPLESKNIQTYDCFYDFLCYYRLLVRYLLLHSCKTHFSSFFLHAVCVRAMAIATVHSTIFINNNFYGFAFFCNISTFRKILIEAHNYFIK